MTEHVAKAVAPLERIVRRETEDDGPSDFMVTQNP